MIFKTVTLTDLFSYYGPCTFDLAPVDERNIVVIMGRNGYGKTSFINAVKLLFMGPAAELRRQVTTAKDRIPTDKQYVCGTDGWWGMLNRKAAGAGRQVCSIKAIWIGAEGEVTVERRWTITTAGYREEVWVDAPLEGELFADAAEAYLEHHLPRDFIPFFFFDGEEVRELAEANSNTVIAKMERLLDIRPIENLQKGLKDLRARWRHQADDQQRAEDLVAKEGELARLAARIDALEQQVADLKTEIQDADDERHAVGRKIEILRGGGSQEDEGKLKERLERQENRRLELLHFLAQSLLGDAFLRLTPQLMDRALGAVEACAFGEEANQAELLAVLKEQLPAIFTSPPIPRHPLTADQAEFYRRRLVKRIEEYEAVIAPGALIRLPASRARVVYKQLADYGAAKQPAASLINACDEIKALEQSVGETKSRLSDLTHLSSARKAELQSLMDREAELGERVLTLKDERRRLEGELAEAGKKQTLLTNQLGNLTEAVEQASRTRNRFELAKRLTDLLETVKGRLRKEKRAELETLFNQHVRELISSHGLLHRGRDRRALRDPVSQRRR